MSKKKHPLSMQNLFEDILFRQRALRNQREKEFRDG